MDRDPGLRFVDRRGHPQLSPHSLETLLVAMGGQGIAAVRGDVDAVLAMMGIYSSRKSRSLHASARRWGGCERN